MSRLQRLADDVSQRFPAQTSGSSLDQRKKDTKPPGGFSFGTSLLGGPQFTDAFQSRRAPSPWDLVEKYKSIVFSMVARNRNAVTRLPLRLFADGSRVQGKPNRNCDPIRVSRAVGARLARAGQVSSAAVDQVYEIRDHPLLDVLDNPDPSGTFTRDKLIGLICAYQDVVGSCFLVPEGNGWREEGSKTKGPPLFLWVLYSQYVLPIRQAGSPMVDHFQYFRDKLPYDQVIWFRQNHSLRDPYGSAYSPTYAGEVYANQEDRQIALFDQILGSPGPSMIASAKDPILAPNDSERKRFEQDLNRKQGGGNARGLLVSNGAWDFTPWSYTPADLAAKEVSEYDLYRLASIFDQPPTYYTVDTNLANLQAADEQHARQGVEPRCKSIAGTLTWMARLWDRRLSFAFDPALPEDDEAKARVVDMQLKNGQITINQANEEGRWPAVPWGDEPWLPGTLVQPSMAQEKHEQALVSEQAAIDQGDDQIEQGSQKLSIEEKKASQSKPAAKGERSVIELQIDRALDRLEEELMRRRAG